MDSEVVGRIDASLLVLLEVGKADQESAADYLADKIVGLRIFEDDNGKMNRSVVETGGAVLAVSQFTLYGDVRRGKRPSFDEAAAPELARGLYEYFVERIRATGVICETGRFQAMMQVGECWTGDDFIGFGEGFEGGGDALASAFWCRVALGLWLQLSNNVPRKTSERTSAAGAALVRSYLSR